jgi:hypothetical protein
MSALQSVLLQHLPYQTVQCHPEDHSLNSHCRGNVFISLLARKFDDSDTLTIALVISSAGEFIAATADVTVIMFAGDQPLLRTAQSRRCTASQHRSFAIGPPKYDKLSILLWLYNPLLGLGRFFSFLTLYTVGMTMDCESALRKASTYKQDNTNTE